MIGIGGGRIVSTEDAIDNNDDGISIIETRVVLCFPRGQISRHRKREREIKVARDNLVGHGQKGMILSHQTKRKLRSSAVLCVRRCEYLWKDECM